MARARYQGPRPLPAVLLAIKGRPESGKIRLGPPPPKSTIDSLLQMRRVSIALHCDFRNSCGDIAEIVLGQFDVCCAQILLKPMQLCSSGNRDDPRFLSKQPSNRDLCRSSLLLPRNVAEHIHQGLVRFPVLLVETGNDVAKIGAIELRVLVDCAREEALPQGLNATKPMPS